ncbi:hypothetical protein AX14_014263 [Amanita brunnescens Koide BX004]|nr:hypothetical protein AX14_014263 [Amanita brunnescens Koide BX004]
MGRSKIGHPVLPVLEMWTTPSLDPCPSVRRIGSHGPRPANVEASAENAGMWDDSHDGRRAKIVQAAHSHNEDDVYSVFSRRTENDHGSEEVLWHWVGALMERRMSQLRRIASPSQRVDETMY